MRKPVLYFTVGLPGSGKTTYLSRLDNVRVVSGDSVREELFGDAALQYSDDYLRSKGINIEHMSARKKRNLCNEHVWRIADKRIEEALREGHDAAVDGIGLNPNMRKKHLRKFCPLAEVHGLFFDVDYETCLSRNARRERNVPVYRMAELAELMVPPTLSEGFDEIDTIDAEGSCVARIAKEPSERTD